MCIIMHTTESALCHIECKKLQTSEKLLRNFTVLFEMATLSSFLGSQVKKLANILHEAISEVILKT